MPIANSFILVVMYNVRKKEIVIHVIDLIKERRHVQNYPIKKIIEIMVSLLEKNGIHHNVLKSLKTLGKLDFEERNASVINNICTSIANLVFYDRCVFKFSLSFWNDKEGLKGMISIKNALSIVAICQNSELTISLQINSNIKVETFYHSYDIDFGSKTILMSDKYKIDNKYDISQSHLYSVIASAGDYTIISEPNLCPSHNYCASFVLYYKNKPKIVFGGDDFKINNFGDILLIGASDKRLVFVKKDKSFKLGEINEYYIAGDSSGISIVDEDGYSGIDITDKNYDSNISIIDTKAVRDLLMNSVNRNSNMNWVGIDITDKVKHVPLGDKLKKGVRRYVGFTVEFELPIFAYYIDYKAEELYLLVWIHLIIDEKIRICLFRTEIKNLLSSNTAFRLVWEFETDIITVLTSETSILSKINLGMGTVNRVLRLLSNKLNTMNGSTNLSLFVMYNAKNAYYDYEYNRRSISASPIDTAIPSTLHLVCRIKQTLF
jgi:hypothetical protein